MQYLCLGPINRELPPPVEGWCISAKEVGGNTSRHALHRRIKLKTYLSQCLSDWARLPGIGAAQQTPSQCLAGAPHPKVLLQGQGDEGLHITRRTFQVNRSEQIPLRLFTPGPVSSLATSPSGSYLAAAVQESITIWQLGTGVGWDSGRSFTVLSAGALLAVLSRHYQPVTVLSFTKDGSHLISGGEDGQVCYTQATAFVTSHCQVLVWPLVTCLARRSLPGHQVGQPEPRYFQNQLKLPEESKNFTIFVKVHLF